MNIVFWNCQGLRPKRKELQNYLLENQIDILALNETFLKPKFKFHLPGYDIYKNDRLVGTKGGVAILVKKGIIVNQEWKNEHFNVITDNEALAIEIELQNGDKVILATIYCPNGNPSLRLFRMINALSKQVIFLGDFNSKHKQFGCVKPNKSGQTLYGIDNVYNIILKNAIGTGFYKVLARAFTISLKLGFIPHAWKIAVLCMLIKPDKPPSQTTSYRPISLLSAIMKLFERVIEKRLRKHLEDNGFFSKYQSSFRKSKSTNDHLFRLSQTIMKSFNRGEHVIAAFLDVEKAFDNVWHNGLRYKIYQLDLPTKLCRWLSDFLVGRVIQVKIEGFLYPKVYPKAGVPQGSNLSPLLFLIYVNDMPNPSHHQTDKSQFADDAGQWAVSKNIDLAAEYLQRDLDKLARWCAKWRIKLNPEKTKVIIFSKSRFAIRAEPALSLYGNLLSYYPQIKFLGITFDNRMTFTKHFEEILERCNQKFHRLRILVNKKWGPSPETILQIYKQCVGPIFEYGIVSTITVSETVITKIQRVQNSFIRLALRLPKYVSARLLHEASGLPYVKERLTSVGQNHLARMHANPLVEHTINSAKTNIAWDKYKTPISILKPPD